ncbi:MEKHLA domain-containing protein [Paraburkholderia ginsengiterrae]
MTNADPDSTFTYGNKAAQRTFEYTWHEQARIEIDCPDINAA